MITTLFFDLAQSGVETSGFPTVLACIPCWGAGYIGIVLFGTSLPGKPAYAVEWRTLVETWHCSVNFFYINQILNWLGVHVIQSVAVSLL